ncbi:energy transducer TonB [Luteimonas sp. MC1895]|uniref:energy transducer TonB n=1 Tax=Luteimonas sp. MC1895 TaxID=2819513 RepID=UPI0018F0FD89|nr:energy transducer TonB [Luteimonas sp. MC1895]MBJ6977935.1 energy transducer TonB [Luteimonas sp. MC1895]
MANPDPQTPPPSRPPEEPRRRTAAPLLWFVLLLALLAFGWFIYNQRSGMGPAPEALPPPPVAIGDGQDAAAERERTEDDARRASREARAADERDRTRTTAPAPASAGPDREASPLARVEPEYPVEAYRRREEGTVLVGANVGADGRPASVEVIRRSGSRALDQAAVDAVRQWTFEPAVRGGRTVAADVQVPVTFRIDR